jgi:hypothetical protein
MKRLVLLWGSSGAYGDDGSRKASEYRGALELIEAGARRYGFEPNKVLYPGHPNRSGVTVGKLSFQSALSEVKEQCRKIEPAWIVGRSFGALIAPAALSCGEVWVQGCRGSVLWGPGFRRFNDAAWPTPAHKAQAVDEYKAFGTHLVSDFFDTLPDIETLVPAAACNLKFARGEKDKYNSIDDLKRLADIHARSQSGFKNIVIELKGLDHTPTPSKLNAEECDLYFDCLFSEFARSS